ncbi:MAG: glycosyltransferase family 2 protein [Deltaproteobacteria bacterium]|nr:glycosyltransferase family 2 protein [Deltaproteobacteria bacterium]
MKTLVITVNYKSAALTLAAVQSVLYSESLGPVHMVVVDNSEDEKEAAKLQQGLPPEVSLLVSPKNMGFGCACNLVFERFEGDLVLLLNPDARLLPGCLTHLQTVLLSSNRIASVSPRVFWDDALRFQLPPSVPFVLFELQSFFAVWGPRSPANRLLSAFWRRLCLEAWQAEKPIPVYNFSGGHVLLRRNAVTRAGGLFDPGFFLYFEDTDLSIRLKKAGFHLMMEPRAKAVHYVDQCGRDDWQRKRSLMAESHARLLEKNGNHIQSGIRRAGNRVNALYPTSGGRPFRPDFTSPFELQVPQPLEKQWLFELSPNENFIPSAGRFGTGAVTGLGRREWALLAPGDYFGRLGSPVGLKQSPETISVRIRKDVREPWMTR